MNDPALPGVPAGAAPERQPTAAGSPEQLVADTLSADAAARRRRDRWRAELQLNELAVADVLLGALRAGRSTLLLVDGAELAGTVLSVGEDVVALRDPTRDWWVALGAIEGVRSERVRPGDGEDRSTLRLDEVLAGLVQAAPVSIVTIAGATLDGDLRAVGTSAVLRERSGDEVVVELSRICRVARRSGRRR